MPGSLVPRAVTLTEPRWWLWPPRCAASHRSPLIKLPHAMAQGRRPTAVSRTDWPRPSTLVDPLTGSWGLSSRMTRRPRKPFHQRGAADGSSGRSVAGLTWLSEDAPHEQLPRRHWRASSRKVPRVRQGVPSRTTGIDPLSVRIVRRHHRTGGSQPLLCVHPSCRPAPMTTAGAVVATAKSIVLRFEAIFVDPGSKREHRCPTFFGGK